MPLHHVFFFLFCKWCKNVTDDGNLIKGKLLQTWDSNILICQYNLLHPVNPCCPFTSYFLLLHVSLLYYPFLLSCLCYFFVKTGYFPVQHLIKIFYFDQLLEVGNVCCCLSVSITWRATQGVSWIWRETSSPSSVTFLEYRAPGEGGQIDEWNGWMNGLIVIFSRMENCYTHIVNLSLIAASVHNYYITSLVTDKWSNLPVFAS